MAALVFVLKNVAGVAPVDTVNNSATDTAIEGFERNDANMDALISVKKKVATKLAKETVLEEEAQKKMEDRINKASSMDEVYALIQEIRSGK